MKVSFHGTMTISFIRWFSLRKSLWRAVVPSTLWILIRCITLSDIWHAFRTIGRSCLPDHGKLLMIQFACVIDVFNWSEYYHSLFDAYESLVWRFCYFFRLDAWRLIPNIRAKIERIAPSARRGIFII